MKKILLIGPILRNLTLFREELIFRLCHEGYSVSLLGHYDEIPEKFKNKGIEFLNMPLDRKGKNPVTDALQILKYRTIIKKSKPDIVLTYTTKPSAYAGIACVTLRIPYIANNSGLVDTRYAHQGLKHILRFIYWFGFRWASHIMYQNSYEQTYINGCLHKNVPNSLIPGSGVNLDKFIYTPYPSEEEGIIFNYVARVEKIKGIEEFLECASCIKLKYKNARFIIYGNFDQSTYRAVVEKKVNEGIIEYGGIQSNMLPYIQKAHAVIHPSYYEGMTNVVLEHSAVGRVCIGSDIPGVNDGIDDGITGYTFPVKDVNALISRVEKFILTPNSEKAKMGYAARLKMEREFDRNIVVNKYLSIIEQILK